MPDGGTVQLLHVFQSPQGVILLPDNHHEDEGLPDCGLVCVHLLHYPKFHIPNQLLVHLILPMDRDQIVAGV